MFSKYSTLFFVFNVFVFCESGFIDTLTKCQVNDGACGKKILQNVLKDLSESGAPDIGLPPIDPIDLKNITVKILDIVDITLIDGIAKGVKSCVIDRFEMIFEDEHAFVDITCETLTVKGKYKLFSASPLLRNVLNADSVRGDGNGEVKLEKINLKFDFAFFVQKRDGEYYLKGIPEKTKYEYDVKKKMTFLADNLYVGDVESSQLVLGLLNENWRFLMSTFGKPFMDKAVQYVSDFIEKFVDGVPAKYYIASDLSSYAKN